MKIYIAGPMTGILFHNHPAFDVAEYMLADMGHDPISPAALDRAAGYFPGEIKNPQSHDWNKFPESMDRIETIRKDLDHVLRADAVSLLDGWEHSVGARAERLVAIWAQKKLYTMVGGQLKEC